MQKKGNPKINALLVIASAVAFLVVLTILILLALHFDIFGVQNPQPQQTTAPASQETVVETPDDDSQPSDENQENSDDSQNQEEEKEEEEEGKLQVGVDDGSDTQEVPDDNENVISFDDLLAAAGQNKEGQ